MTMPYRVWDGDFVTRAIKCDDPVGGWDCAVIGDFTIDHFTYGLIGMGNMGGTYQQYWAYMRPEDGIDLPESADVLHAYRLLYHSELLKNTTTHTSHTEFPKVAKNSNAWIEGTINGKYYNGVNQWDSYPLPVGLGGTNHTYSFASLPSDFTSWFPPWDVGGYVGYGARLDFARNGFKIHSGNAAGGSIANNQEYLIETTPQEFRVQYLNAVVNSISKLRLNPIGGDTVIFAGLGFYNSAADLNRYLVGGPPAWNRLVDFIYLEGREGQGTTTLSRAAADFTVDSDTQITIAAMPALAAGTYNIRLQKKDANNYPTKEIDSYAGDYTCDDNGLMTAAGEGVGEGGLDRLVLVSGGVGGVGGGGGGHNQIFLTKWRFKDAEGNIIFRYYSPIDVYAPSTFYDGRIVGVSGIRRALDDNTGLYLMPDMTVEMSNTDFEFSKLLAKYMVKNQIVELLHAWTDEPHAWRSHSFIGIVDDVEFKHPVTTFYLKDIFKKYFDKKVPLYRITNEEFPNAHEVAIGQSMPEVLGLNYLNKTDCKGAVQAHCIDTTLFKYLGSHGNLHSITQVYSDGALKATPGDYAVSYDPLGYTLITFTSNQGDNKITFNCKGYMYDDVYDWNSGNGYVQNPAYIIAFSFALLAEIPLAYLDMASIDVLAAKFETAGYEESGRLILQNEEDFENILAELLFTYGTKGYPTKEGKFKTEKKDITDFLSAMTIWGQLDVEGQPERKYNYKEMINRARAVGDLYPTHDLNLVSKEEERAKSIEDFETEVEAKSPFEFPWTNSAALIAERLIEELVKRSYGDKRLYISLPMKFFDDLDINTDFRFQDIWGLSLTGAGEAGRYYYISSLSYNPMGQSIDIVAIDLQYLLQAYFIFGDEAELAALWVNATYENRMYGYMCDEDTDQFSDGEPGKILIDKNLL